MALNLFGRWDMSTVKVEDAGLQKYMNVAPAMLPRTYGRYSHGSSTKMKMSIVERFINKLMIPGHKGKKHKTTSGRCPGTSGAKLMALEKAFEIIEKKTAKNPVQILVKAVENAAPLEEIAAYRMGGSIARKAVIISPQRRLDLALRHLTQGIYSTTFAKKKGLPQAVADELMLAAAQDKTSFAVNERARLEKEAEGAR